MKKIIASIILALAFTVTAGPAFAAEVPPAPSNSFIADNAGILTNAQENEVNLLIQQIGEKTGDKVAVLTVDSLDGDSIEDFSLNVANAWGVGEADKDNGVLFVIAMEDRALRIEVGSGLETVLTDDEAKNILDNVTTPAMRTEDQYGAVQKTVDSIGTELADIAPTATTNATDDGPDPILAIIIGGAILLAIFTGCIFAYIAKTMVENKLYPLLEGVNKQARSLERERDNYRSMLNDNKDQLSALQRSPEGKSYASRIKREAADKRKAEAERRAAAEKVAAARKAEEKLALGKLTKQDIKDIKKVSNRSKRTELTAQRLRERGYVASTGYDINNIVGALIIMNALQADTSSSYSRSSYNSSSSSSSSSYSSPSYDSGSSFSGGGFDGGGSSGGW